MELQQTYKVIELSYELEEKDPGLNGPKTMVWERFLYSLVPKTIPLSTVICYTLRNLNADQAHIRKIPFVFSLFLTFCSILCVQPYLPTTMSARDFVVIKLGRAPGLQDTYKYLHFTGAKTHPQSVQISSSKSHILLKKLFQFSE